jgi:hypothetical protein
MDIRENFYNRLHEARNPELKKLIRNYAGHKAAAYDSGDSGDDESMDHHEDEAKKILKVIKKNHGHEAANHAEMSADSNIFGTERKRARRPDSLEGGLRANLRKDLTKKGVIPKNTQKAMQGVAASGEGKLKRKISKPKGIIPEETLNELRGKSSLSDDERKELKDRIRKKHGKAWDDTIGIRKEKKSSGPADTRDMDKLRKRLARMYNKLDK